MNDRARSGNEPEPTILLQYRIAVLESDLVKLETEIKALKETVSSLINRGLGIGLAISAAGVIAGYFLSFFKNIKIG